MAADQGNAFGQVCYGVCLLRGEGVSIDMRSAAPYLKLSADQGNAVGQVRYGVCLRDGKGVSIDTGGALSPFAWDKVPESLMKSHPSWPV
jgi:TPR repeat protein